MKQFQIKPVIQCFDRFSDFIDSVQLGPNDCILTARTLYQQWLQPLHSESRALIFEDYGRGEPTDEMVERILTDFNTSGCTRVIAIGGGSILDIAKLLALKPSQSTVQELFDGQVQPTKDKELMLVPTTCGTGSEMTCIAIVGIPSKKTKKGLAVPALYADRAILIPELLYSLPKSVVVTSSLDALTHALESFVAPRAHAYSELFSIEAIRLLLKAYQTLAAEADDGIRSVAGDLLRASNYAGIAFGNVGVGAVHALAYPLGENYHVFHGEACARFINAVFQVYRDKNPEGKLHRLTELLAQLFDCSETQDPWRELALLINRLQPEKPLREYGMAATDIESFADSVVREQQRLLVNDYVDLSRDEIRDVYQRLW